MYRNKLLTAVITALAAWVVSPAKCQDSSRAAPPPPWERATILVAEIEQAGVSRAGSLSNAGEVRIKVTRVVRDRYRLALRPGEFEGPYFWEGVSLEAGQRYLLYSNRNEGIEAALRSPYNVTLLTDRDDAVGDLDLILGLAHLPLPQQASGVASAVNTPAKPHSYLLALYAASLLATGGFSDTYGLAQSLERSTDQTFSDEGKRSLLGACYRQIGTYYRRLPENLSSVFFTLMSRYFLLEPEEPGTGLTAIQSDVLQYARFIGEVETVKAAFRSALPQAASAQLRKRVAQLAADGRLEPDKRAQARQLLTLIDPE